MGTSGRAGSRHRCGRGGPCRCRIADRGGRARDSYCQPLHSFLFKIPVLARVSSTRPPSPARPILIDDQVCVVFDEGEEGVAPGQACALYDPDDPDRVLGGGFIRDTTAVAV